MTSPQPRTLLLYTDFVCPFCYIAEHSTVPKLVARSRSMV